MSDEPLVPQQPEYEEIVIRELTFGFVGGSVEEITLYPEDSIAIDPAGNTLITFHSKKEGNLPAPTFSAHPRNSTWQGSRYLMHRRVKGTLRPTPEQVVETFKRNREQERRQKLQEAVTDMIRMGTVGSDYDPNA